MFLLFQGGIFKFHVCFQGCKFISFCRFCEVHVPLDMLPFGAFGSFFRLAPLQLPDFGCLGKKHGKLAERYRRGVGSLVGWLVGCCCGGGGWVGFPWKT